MYWNSLCMKHIPSWVQECFYHTHYVLSTCYAAGFNIITDVEDFSENIVIHLLYIFILYVYSISLTKGVTSALCKLIISYYIVLLLCI